MHKLLQIVQNVKIRPHKGECLAGSNACFKCGKLRHHAKDCQNGDISPQGHVKQAQRCPKDYNVLCSSWLPRSMRSSGCSYWYVKSL